MRSGIKDGPERDFTKIGEISAPAFAVPPDPEKLFARRAARFASLAEGHPLGAYLTFLARLVEIQRGELTEPAPHLDKTRTERAVAHGMPALSKDILSDGDDFARVLDGFLRRASIPEAPPAAEQARARLLAMAAPQRLALAEAVFEGAYPAEQIGECLYVAAALQLHLTRLAASLDAARLRPVGEGVCPVCGGLPVASSLVGWAGAQRARYCCCGLCGTRWNYVRVQCVACGSPSGVSLRIVEGQSEDVAVEACAECRCYIKYFREDRRPEIEPLADDIASYGLDLLVREEGFLRHAANPLMVTMG